MPILSLNDISGGIRRLPPRLMPQNSLKDALNIIPNINGNIFETCGLNSLFTKYTTTVSDCPDEVISCSINGVSTLVYYGKFIPGHFIIHRITSDYAMYEPDANTLLDYPLLLLSSRGTYLFHNAKYNCQESDIRKLYKDLDNPRFGELVGGNEGYDYYKLPQLIKSKMRSRSLSGYITIEPFFYADLNDITNLTYFGYEAEVPAQELTQAWSGMPDTKDASWGKSTTPPRITFYEKESEIYVKVGIRFDGYQSIVGKCEMVKTTIYGVEDSGVFRLLLSVHPEDFESFGERITGFDIYVARPLDLVENDDDSLYWQYVDTLQMDYNEELYKFPGTYTLTTGIGIINTLTARTPLGDYPVSYLRPDIYNECILEILDINTGIVLQSIIIQSHNEFVIVLHDLITVASGTYELKIRTKWHLEEDGDGYTVVKFVSSLSGEPLMNRTGVSDRKIETIYDYCPPAHFIESFKGRIWLADYYEYGEERKSNRLICNVINFDGNVCEDVYDVMNYMEFDGNITFLKATDEVLYIGTTVGLYSLRYIPSTNEYSPSWSINKISDIIITDRKRVFAVKDKLFLYDGNAIYISDGVFLKNILTEEIVDIIKENYTESNFTSNKYAIAYDSMSDSIYLFLDKIIKLKDGILKYYVSEFDSIFACPQLFNNRLYFFMGSLLYSINSVSTGYNVDNFLIETHDNDLGTKEDKYLNEFVIGLYKSKGQIVVMEIYNESGIMLSYTFGSARPYDDRITIKPPKSVNRRFKTIRYKMYDTSGSPYFKLYSIDVDFDMIKKTTIPSNETD